MIAENEGKKPEWEPTVICKAVGPDGNLWAESSSEEDVRKMMRPGDKFYRLYERVEQIWIEEP